MKNNPIFENIEIDMSRLKSLEGRRSCPRRWRCQSHTRLYLIYALQTFIDRSQAGAVECAACEKTFTPAVVENIEHFAHEGHGWLRELGRH